VICHTHVSPEDMAVLKCGALPRAHECLVHVTCAEEHGTKAAMKFLKSRRLPVICLQLKGSGAPPNLISKSKHREYGLEELLDATTGGKRKDAFMTVNGTVGETYFKMGKAWANDESIAKKLLLAACPHGDGCFLTIETYKPPQQGNGDAAASEQASKAPRKLHLLAMGGPCEEADDKGHCVGTKQNGDACPRSANELGGDADAGLCRRCKDSMKKTAALFPLDKQEGEKCVGTVGAGKKMPSKHKDGSTGAIPKRTAKPVETCSSCGSEHNLNQENLSPNADNLTCEECMQPILKAPAALAAGDKASDEGARVVMGIEARGKEPRAEAQSKEVRQAGSKQANLSSSAKTDFNHGPAALNVDQVSAAGAVGSSTSSASKVTPKVAKTLAEAGQTIRLLRENRVSDVALLQLVEKGLTSLEHIMAAHKDGLSKLGIKVGPRVHIVKILSPLTLESEDEEVKDVLERFSLGKYRARCAEEQINIEALRCFEDEPNAVLEVDLGVQPEDLEAFRAAARSVHN